MYANISSHVFIFFNLLFKKVHCSMFKNVYCLLFIVQKVHSSLFKKVFSLLFIVYCSKKFKKFKKVYPVGYLFLFSLRCSMGLSYGVNCSTFVVNIVIHYHSVVILPSPWFVSSRNKRFLFLVFGIFFRRWLTLIDYDLFSLVFGIYLLGFKICNWQSHSVVFAFRTS